MFVEQSALPKLAAIRQAQQLLAKYFAPTPLVKSPSLGGDLSEVLFKNETVLPTGSFKPRGAIYALTKNLDRGKLEEIVAASTGNHGAAVAFAAKTLGVNATIFLPENPNPVKRKKIEDLGARIVCNGSIDLSGASQAASEYARRPGVYFLNDATDPDLPTGPATIGAEIVDQLPKVSAVYVPMGDTALIRGIGAAIKQLSPTTQVIGVQAEQAPSYALSWRARRPVPTETCDTIADGLATRTPESENVSAIGEVVDDVVLVSEEQMIEAVRRLHIENKIVAEPSGAAATAGFMVKPASGIVALVVSGGNISPEIRKRAGIAA